MIGRVRSADRPGAAGRLDAVAELTRIGADRDGFDAELLTESAAVLRRARQRLRLSGGHTVVAIAGGTGSGKSTLFNALAGADFSPPGVTRPATRDVHACVWGMEGAAPLLDWLGVERRYRFARASELDSGEKELRGLILLDLPDHDSVVGASSEVTDRIARLADRLIWVLDPQKYADAAVHHRYLVPLADHAGILTVVLSQIDLLTPEEVSDCGEDLRRLLDSEGLRAAALHAASARTGEGVDELRALLAGAVAASRAADERISADIDSLLSRYAAYAAGSVVPSVVPDSQPGSGGPFPAPASSSVAEAAAPGEGDGPSAPSRPSRPPWELNGTSVAEPDSAGLERNVPEGPAATLAGAFGDASGLAAVADGRATAREMTAARFASWPAARVPWRRRGDPVGSPRGAQAGPTGLAPQSEVDNAITTFADAVGHRLPEPWPGCVRRAARSRADEIPPALADAIRVSGRERPEVPARWRLIAAGQWLLAAVAAAALIWAAVTGVTRGLFGALWLIPVLVVAAAAALALGWLVSAGCQAMAAAAGDRERERALGVMREAVAGVTRDLVLVPVGREIAAYERFRRELSLARGDGAR